MKKTEKLLATLLMITMLIVSVGLLYVSIYASSGSGIYSSFASVVFDCPTGIRYNNLTNEFEVFNEAGVSWIASGRYISIDGRVEPNEPQNPELSINDYAIADGNQTYNIMCDIAYSGNIDDEDVYNMDFDVHKIYLGAQGILNGRGFTLKNFKIKSLLLTTLDQTEKQIGTALVAKNEGVVRNLNVSNVIFDNSLLGDGDTIGYAAGLMCGINIGTIDNCQTYGMDILNLYETDQYLGLYGIAALSSGRIINSTNNANLTNTATNSFGAGISSVLASASLLNNINNGDITAEESVAGIAIDLSGLAFIVRGNVNNGNLTANISVSGIVDGGGDLSDMDAKGNVNNGNLICDDYYELYYGCEDLGIEIPTYGIKYNPELNLSAEAPGGFEIYNADGISWISSGDYFDENGNKGQGEGAVQATATSYYEINEEIKVINYNRRTKNETKGLFNTAFYGGSSGNAPSISAGGVFNGNNCTLVGFPLRQCGTEQIIQNYYSTLFYENRGIIQDLEVELDVSLTEITGQKFAGGLVGYTYGGEIISVTVRGSMTFGASLGFAGGIVGRGAQMKYTDLSSFITLSGALCIGGIVGVGHGSIYNNYFGGKILSGDGLPSSAGGIMGSTDNDVYAYDCYVSGSISGGTVGWFSGLYFRENKLGITTRVNGGSGEGSTLYSLEGAELPLVCLGAAGAIIVV